MESDEEYTGAQVINNLYTNQYVEYDYNMFYPTTMININSYAPQIHNFTINTQKRTNKRNTKNKKFIYKKN